jgi:hypothetical protein
MKRPFYLAMISILFLFSTGCSDDDPLDNDKIVGTGPIVTQNLDLDSFNKIENVGVANFYITIGTPQSVVLKAQQNIIDVMTYEVMNQTLKVGLQENVSIENHEEIRFDIIMESINNIELVGVGDFTLTGDDQEELTINVSGVGNIKAFDMRVGTCLITFTGVGDCEVYVIDELTVILSGVGNINYKGNPTINSTITGTGELINSN